MVQYTFLRFSAAKVLHFSDIRKKNRQILAKRRFFLSVLGSQFSGETAKMPSLQVAYAFGVAFGNRVAVAFGARIAPADDSVVSKATETSALRSSMCSEWRLLTLARRIYSSKCTLDILKYGLIASSTTAEPCRGPRGYRLSVIAPTANAKFLNENAPNCGKSTKTPNGIPQKYATHYHENTQ